MVMQRRKKRTDVEYKYIVNSKNYYCISIRRERFPHANKYACIDGWIDASKEVRNSSLRDFVFLKIEWMQRERSLFIESTNWGRRRERVCFVYFEMKLMLCFKEFRYDFIEGSILLCLELSHLGN